MWRNSKIFSKELKVYFELFLQAAEGKWCRSDKT